MNIYIPSSGRHDKQTTLTSLPPVLSNQGLITVVVPVDEYSIYRDWTGSNIKIVAPDIPKGIGHARQWCCDQEPIKCLMLDDDLVFATRRGDEPTKFRDAKDKEIIQALSEMGRALNTYSHVGMATREGGNRMTEPWDYNTRLLRILGYRTDIMRELGVRFDAIPVMEDFFVSLSLLTAGTQNAKLNWMVQNQGGSNTEGGCSQYRTPEVQAAAAHVLHERFPKFVKVVEKTTKTAWGGGTRTDVTVYWKKALASAEQRRQNLSSGAEEVEGGTYE